MPCHYQLEDRVLQKDHGLEARDLKPLPAAWILALREVVAPYHIRAGLRKAGPVTVISRASQRSLFRPDQPADFVGLALMALVAVQERRLQRLRLVKKVTLLHKLTILT